MEKKIFIIGVSCGIGLELVKIWLENRYKVISCSRGARENLELLELKNMNH